MLISNTHFNASASSGSVWALELLKENDLEQHAVFRTHNALLWLFKHDYSPSWEKLNLVPEGDVMLDPDENGELPAVSCSPPAEWDRSHSFASSWLRSWEDGVYLQKQTGFSLGTWIFIWLFCLKKPNNHEMSQDLEWEREKEKWKNPHMKLKD